MIPSCILLNPLTKPELQAACVQAEAALQAGLIQAHAASWAGVLTLVAGGFAVAAALIGAKAVREQIRDQRQLEHTEKALSNGLVASKLTRAIRSRFMSYDGADFETKQKRASAYRQQIKARFGRAWEAREEFSRHYALVGFYHPGNRFEPDLAQRLGECLSDLEGHAELMFAYDAPDDDDGPHGREQKKLHALERKAFYGFDGEDQPDKYEQELRQFDKLLVQQLGFHLSPPTVFKRIRGWRPILPGWGRSK